MKKIVVFSWVVLLLVTGLAVWTWVNLPPLEQYPVHWNGSGMVDRYGSKMQVGLALFMMPLQVAFIFAIFTFIPKIEPVRSSIDANKRPYNYIWIITMLFLAGVSGFISYIYANIQTGSEITKFPISFLVIGVSAFFIFMGNIMGKFKRNFLVGIKTPWTLTSDLSWDKTHRLSGRMFVGAGLIGVASVFITKPETALYILLGLIFVIAVFALVYSFLVWKNDPAKRN